MVVFSSSEQLYNVLKSVFSQIEEKDPESARAVSKSKLVMRLRTTSPITEVSINGRHNPLQISYGVTQLRPDIEMEIPALMLHQILLEQISFKKAIASGNIKMRGPVWKALVFENIFRTGQRIYPEVLSEQGVLPNS